MAGDRQRYDRALRHWDQLRIDGAFSYPEEAGITAILCAYPSENKKRALKDRRIFRKEAFAIADVIRSEGGMPEVILNPSSDDTFAVTVDEKVANIIAIGHGSISELEIGDEAWSWEQGAGDTDHLKQGYFMQRQCGGTAFNLNAPLGLFMVSDHRAVYAAVNILFDPMGLNHPINESMGPVFEESRVTYAQVKQLLPRTEGFS